MDNIKEWARNKTTADMSWESGRETLLDELRSILVALFEDTQFTARRNPKKNEYDIDIIYEGRRPRIGYIYPKKNLMLFDFALKKEFVDKIRPKMELPDEMDVKPGRVLSFRQFRIPIEKVVEIADCLSQC